MKRLVFISGALFSCIILLGFLFKIMHWPGASVAIVLGIGGLALIFIPSLAKYTYDMKK